MNETKEDAVPKTQGPTRAKLAELAREVGYTPPDPKFGAEQGADYLVESIDYTQLLLDPERTALVVVDMQNIFVRKGAPSTAGSGESIAPAINGLAETFRDLELPVIWTLWCHRPDGSNLGRNAAFWRDLVPLPEDSDLAQMHPSMDVRDEDITMTKPNYSAFWGTDLEVLLHTRGIEALVLTGVATDICLGSTLIDAFHRDYTCVVVSDGTTTTTPYQQETLWMHENYWARVLTADEVGRELRTLARREERVEVETA
jgi:biuret amidohydrolase